MQPCKLDLSRPYALALEGGGAKGAYEVGVWECLAEEGIRLKAVSGTSVGALNGAFVAMGQLAKAKELWQNMRYSQIMRVDDGMMKKLMKGELLKLDLTQTAGALADVLRGGGLDIAPLQQLLATYIDEDAIRASPVELYMVTFSLSDMKVMELRAKDLPAGTLRDMLLASAYLPGFRNEKLGGKRYVDGGVADNIPLHALIENNYTDLIAVRTFGPGVYRPIRIPADVRVTFIAPTESLGRTLDFDPASAARNLSLGYLDAKRALHGLAGSAYYIDRQLTDADAYAALRAYAEDCCRAERRPLPLRELNEKLLPRLASRLKCAGDYYDCFVAALEAAAREAGLDPFRIRTERELQSELAPFFRPAEGRIPNEFRRLLPAIS